VTHSLLFGFNNVLALCKISLWHLELFFAGWVFKELTFGYFSIHYVTIIVDMWCLDAHVAKTGLSDQYSAFCLSIAIAWIISMGLWETLSWATMGERLCGASSASGQQSCAHAGVDAGWRPASPPHCASSCLSLPAVWSKCREACGPGISVERHVGNPATA
jgi:hypothetical protein